MHKLIAATDVNGWNAALACCGDLDPCFLPEYHQAYSLRIENSRAFLWHHNAKDAHFIYPFLLTPVMDTGYFDISGIYGYTGPIASSDSPEFISNAWKEFNEFAEAKNIIAEFSRFSPFNKNERYAHPQMKVIANRSLAVSYLPETEEKLLALLGSKTRNMLKKAEQTGLTSRELVLPDYLPDFRDLYAETMSRNQAPGFFDYDDDYWNKLLGLGSKGLRCFGVFAGEKLVAASMAVVSGKAALYHLGASLTQYAKQGAGNLSLFAMSRSLMQSGAEFINMTGGRTAAENDSLLLFKKSNATALATFYIGKRVINAAAYQQVTEQWQKKTDSIADAEKIIFWRD